MVKVSGPMFSLDASGSIAGTLVASKWKGRNYMRSLVKPSNPKSGGQVGVRSMFRFLAQNWAALSAGNKATWEERAATTAISAFNAFMAYNQFRWRNFLAPSKEDPATPLAFTGTLGVLSATAGARSITVQQLITAAGNGWGLAFFRSPTGTFDGAFTNCVRVLPFATTDPIIFVDTPLAAGTYYYCVRTLSDDGAIGADSTEVNAVVT